MSDINIDPQLKNNAAASYINCAPDTLRQNSVTSNLPGVRFPVFIKIGRSIFYKNTNNGFLLAKIN